MEIKPDEIEVGAKIKVVGVGGGGGSSVTRMINSNLQGVHFIAINTDAQALHHNPAQTKVHIGKELTRGLGAGANPDIGRRAAEENSEDIYNTLKDADLIFLTYGLGGGTGTGAGPVIAEIAKETGALVVAVLTMPFSFEGFQRMESAKRGLKEIQDKVDTLIIIPNDKILQIVDNKTTMIDAFRIVDDVLFQGVKGIADIITNPGFINLDFNDVKTIMRDSGTALMGIGMGTGEGRALTAARLATESPLLDLTVHGAKNVLISIMGGPDLTMDEINEASTEIKNLVDPQAKIIFGVSVDESYQGQVKVTVIATGFDKSENSIEKNMLGKNMQQIPQQFHQQNGFSQNTNYFFQNGKQNSLQSGVDMAYDPKTNPFLTPQNTDLDDDFKIPTYLRTQGEDKNQ
ncbi:MAG: hypothetical protein Fur0024_3910 [Patescibacteria group bacterium]